MLLIADRSSAVSLPEVPLLGVLPGTGGLTRLTDKRRVRRDHTDVFCTTVEGIRDELVKPQRFREYVAQRAHALASLSDRPTNANGIRLTPLDRKDDATGFAY